MRVVYCEPHKKAKTIDIDGKLETMQKLVGGYIEAVYPFHANVALVCDEEGYFNAAQPNREINGSVILGPFFLCSLMRDDFASLPEDLAERYEGLMNACMV